MQVITTAEYKKEAPVYQNLSASKQTFDQIRRLQAINGQIVIRGKQGRRDRVYPLDKAIKRFSKWFVICRRWHAQGFLTQIEQLKLVLEELGSKIQEAIAQRIGGAQSITPMPQIVSPKFIELLQRYIQELRLM